MKKSEKGYERIERLIEAGNRIQKFCELGHLDLAQEQYKAAKEFIKRYGDEQPGQARNLHCGNNTLDRNSLLNAAL
jgi:hypothetical protein